MTVWQLDLTLLEPLCLATRPAVGNQADTLDSIPAVALRGALAASLSRAGHAALLHSLFSAAPESPRYLGALPLHPTQHFLAVPTPAAFLQNKGDAGLRGQDGCWNALYDPPPHQIGSRVCQWKRCSAPWLLLDSGCCALDHFVLTPRRTMHTALHYARRAYREGALYSRTELPAGLPYRAWISDPHDLWAQTLQPTRVYLGKRRGAGLGSVGLEWSPTPHLPFHQDLYTLDEVCVQLLSPAFVPSPGGAWLKGLSNSDWSRLLGLDVTVLAARSAASLLQGWSGSWGLPREAAPAIAAGSCWRLAVLPRAASDLRQALTQLQLQGLGLRRAEGFGWLAVDPPWLRQGRHGAISPDASPERYQPASLPLAPPLPWPGVTAQTSVLLTQSTRAFAFAAKLRQELHSPSNLARERVERLLSVARRVPDVAAIHAFVSAMRARSNSHHWDQVAAALAASRALELHDLALARFTLEAALASFPLEAQS